MKKQNLFQRIWDAITFPFVSIAIIIDEDRRQNLDGYWDKYWERKNRKAAKREARKLSKEVSSMSSNMYRIQVWYENAWRWGLHDYTKKQAEDRMKCLKQAGIKCRMRPSDGLFN